MKIELDSIASVYSGLNGRCCCGCAGKHTYTSAGRAWAAKNRGYKIDDKEVNDRTVKLIVNKIEKAISAGAEAHLDGTSNVSAIVGGRLYIAYFRD